MLGQGEAISLNGKGSVQAKMVNYSSTSQTKTNETSLAYIPIEGADLSISTLSIETQEDSEKALGAIDYALDYVAAGAIESWCYSEQAYSHDRQSNEHRNQHRGITK